MKYIIVGLGNFGASFAQKLTEQGNEVIGIDTNMTRWICLKKKSPIPFAWMPQMNLPFWPALQRHGHRDSGYRGK